MAESAEQDDAMNGKNASSEQMNDWHALPMLLGEAITMDRHTGLSCGGYLVVRDEDETVRIYREVDHAQTAEELETEGDRMWEFYDYVTGNELVAEIPEPDGGWKSETEALPEDIFGGFE